MRSIFAVPRFSNRVAMLVPIALAIGCHATAPATTVSAPAVAATPAAALHVYEPARDLGALFHDVQMARVFPDSKSFVDAKPRSAPAEIAALYDSAKTAPGFDLRAFVARHFDPPQPAGAGVR
jgi:alpha,alpha-trehalase